MVKTCILNVPILDRRTCERIIADAFATMERRDFVPKIREVIQRTLDAGARALIPDFHIFVTGYAQFFNAETTQCNDVTFAIVPYGSERTLLTQERRRSYNSIALTLNAKLRQAVQSFPATQVTWIDYDDTFEGHRYCDRVEPTPDDPQTWFFEFYTKIDPPPVKVAIPDVFKRQSISAAPLPNDHPMMRLLAKAGFYDPKKADTPNHGATSNAKNDGDMVEALFKAAGNDPEMVKAASDYFRIFHPKSPGHSEIRRVLLPEIVNRFPGLQRQVIGSETYR